MIIKNKRIGKYEVCLKDTWDINCTCVHGSLYPQNWIKGSKVCKHIVQFVKEYKE